MEVVVPLVAAAIMIGGGLLGISAGRPDERLGWYRSWIAFVGGLLLLVVVLVRLLTSA